MLITYQQASDNRDAQGMTEFGPGPSAESQRQAS